jgi:hypothetical protein
MIEEQIKARKKLYRMANSFQRKGRSAQVFKNFIYTNWPTVFDRVSKKELEHLIALFWRDYHVVQL